MDNAEGGPGPSAARIKLTFPSSRTNGELAVGSSTNTHPLREDRDFSRLHDSSTNTVNLNDLSGDGITDGPAHIDARASTVVRGRGNRGRRGGRGKGAQRRDRDSRPGTRTNPARNAGRQSLSRTQEMMLDSDGKLNRKLTISFSKGSNTIRLGGEGARKSSFLGDYDRDLDENPSEPLVFEEQFVLRVPERMAGGLREMVKGKSKGLEGVEIKFLDSRRAAFKYEGKTYSSKLVDLPNIIESQKTFDARHLFKVADISQMLVVDEPVEHENAINASALNIDEFVWPHGITPPLRHVRKRRFRKRLSRRAIEVVEESVEELIQKDDEAEETYTDLIDVNVDPDVPDSYYISYDPDAIWDTQEGNESEFDGSEIYEDPGSVVPQSDWDGESGFYDDQEGLGEYSVDDDEEGEVYDDDLAAALRQEMKEGTDDEDVDDDGALSGDDEDEEGARSGEEEDDDTAELRAKIKQYTGEIKVLETTIDKKRSAFTGGNPIMVKRFEETIAGLQADVNTKSNARQALQDDLEAKHAAKRRKSVAVELADPILPGQANSDPDQDSRGLDDQDIPVGGSRNASRQSASASRAGTPSADEDDDDDDLFGDNDEEDDDAMAATPEAEDIPTESHAHTDEVGTIGDHDSESIDAEMAAMLNAELGAIDSAEAVQASAHTADESSAIDINNLTYAGPSRTLPDHLIQESFGVEGGVGMRRLASGVLEDDDDGDSDSSASSD